LGASLLILPTLGLSQSLKQLKISPDSLTGGASATGQVRISKVAPAAGLIIQLASDQAFVQVPASVMIAPGANTATFAVTTSVVGVQGLADVTATDPNGKTETEDVEVKVARSAIHELEIHPEKVAAGNSATGTVELEAQAPAGALTITLSSDQAFAQVPATVVIAAGAKSADFTVTTATLSTSSITNITGIDPTGAMRSALLRVSAPILAKTDHISIQPEEVVGGQSATGTISLNHPAPAAGFVVSLSSSQPLVQVPATITITEGVKSATFAVTTSVVTATTSATVTATDPDGTMHTATIKVKAAKVSHLEELSLQHDDVVGGNPSTGTLTLEGVAPAGGLLITLTSDQAFAQVPASVIVPAGAKKVTFTITTTAVTTTGIATITATDPTNITASRKLTVKRGH